MLLKFRDWTYALLHTEGNKITSVKRSLVLISSLCIIAIGIAGCSSEPTLTTNSEVRNSELAVVENTPPEAQSNTPDASSVAQPGAVANISTDQEVDNDSYDAVIHFPAEKYPETASHILSALENGEPAVCTIDRDGADENRDESLAGIPTKKGYDRDEWPMAMCLEGGSGADVAYVPSSDNRGSGSWVGNQLESYTDGTRVLFVIDGGKSGNVEEATPTSKSLDNTSPNTSEKTTTEDKPKEVVKEVESTTNVYYKNCDAVRAAGADPIYEGEPGYSSKLDRDGDGVGCERK